MTIPNPRVGGTGPLNPKAAGLDLEQLTMAKPAVASTAEAPSLADVTPTDEGDVGLEFVNLDLDLESDKPRALGRLDLQSPMLEGIQRALPGAKFEGKWTLQQLQQVKAAIEAVPEPLRLRLHGVTFVQPAPKNPLPGGQAALADLPARAVFVSASAFELPMVQGVPAVQGAIASELGRLIKAEPKAIAEFARLSGWQQATVSATGDLIEAMGPAEGVAAFAPAPKPAEAAPKAPTARRLGEDRGPARPGTGPLKPGAAPAPQRPVQARTGPLTPPGQPAAPPARPGTGPLKMPQAGAPARPAGPAPSTTAPQPTARAPQPPAAPAGAQRPAAGPHPAPQAPPAARGTGRLTSPPAPGQPTAPARPASPSKPLAPGQAPGQPTARRTGPLPPARPVPAVGPETAAQGGRMMLPSGNAVVFKHEPGARFAPGAAAARDPYTDYGEALRTYMFAPQKLLAAAPEKFLFLNTEARQFSAVQVAEMAKAEGVSLSEVVTTMVSRGLASQPLIERLCQFHGLRGEVSQLKAVDQTLLDRSATLNALVDRLALDLSVQGAGTRPATQQAAELATAYHQLAAKLPLVPSSERLLDGETKGAFRWLLQKAESVQANRRQDQMSELRAQFQQLPLAVQLKADPRLALGATWFTLTPQERSLLDQPESLQRLIGQAAERSDQVAYVPQNLTAGEKRTLATRTTLLALFDPAREGAQLRAKLGGMPAETHSRLPASQDPPAALKALVARNGEKVWDLLPDADRARFSDPRQAGDWKALMADPVMQDALVTLREGSTGAEQIRAAVLKTVLAAPPDQDMRETAKACLAAVKDAQDRLFTALDASPLDLALTAINRQVQEGNLGFVQRFLDPPQGRLDHVVGPFVWNRLSPAEKKLMNDEGYRRHLVAEGAEMRATGASLAEEAREFQRHTESLQQAFDYLLRPENGFRAEFERDPVGALQRRGLWQQLPDPAQQAILQARNTPQLPQLVAAVQQAIAPILTQQAVSREYRENLRKSVRQINAGNYRGLFRVLEMPRAELTRTVTTAIQRAMEHGELIPRTGTPGMFA